MLGAIIGDIVGSVYEWHSIKTKEFPLFREDCHFTDDTVMTVATADALMNGGKTEDFIDAYKRWGRMYPNVGYGGRFGAWLNSDNRKPYNSFGNGSAMRVSPIGFFFEPGCDWEAVDCCARRSAEVTHDHPEGIKGAQATVDAIMLMRCAGGRNIPERKAELKALIEEKYGYDLSQTLDELRPAYSFKESCQETVPQAIIAFLESTGFEDALRNAVSLGGDSDTLAAITGGIAEAAYGIPQWIADKAWTFLDEPLRNVYRRWREAGIKTFLCQ